MLCVLSALHLYQALVKGLVEKKGECFFAHHHPNKADIQHKVLKCFCKQVTLRVLLLSFKPR